MGKKHYLLNCICVIFIISGIISCDNNITHYSTDQRAALQYLDSIINNNDSIISIEVIDYFSCSEDTIWALFHDHQYNAMRKKESKLFQEILDERYKMREYEYNSDRHRWNIERLQDEQNQLKEDMSEYEKKFCPPLINDVALIQYKTNLNPNRRYICLEYNHSHNKVIREIKNEGKCGFSVFLKNNKYGIKQNGYNDTILPPLYDNISKYSNYGCACYILTEKGKYGLFDDTLGIVIPIKYDSIFIRSGYYIKPIYYVKKQNVWGAYNNSGGVIIPIEYDGILINSTNGDMHYIDDGDTICFVKKGGVAVGLCFGSANTSITDEGLWGVYTASGKQIFPCEYRFNNLPNLYNN